MKKVKNVLRALMILSALISTQVFAFDIVSYLVPQPGAWAISQESPGSAKQAYVAVRGQRGQTITNWYSDDGSGSGWVDDVSQVFTVSRSSLVHTALRNESGWWLLLRPMRIPRFMSLHEPFFYEGALVNTSTQERQPYTFAFEITEEGLTAVTQAGTFTDCIKQKLYSHLAGIARMSTNILCPGRGEVKSWISKIRDVSDAPLEQRQNSFQTEMFDYGDSGAPFP